MYAPNSIHQIMQAVHNSREKYSNLVFFVFNALFLLAMFWMLPALGSDSGRPVAASRRSTLHAARQQTEKIIMVQSNARGLLQSFISSFPKLPR
jgi:hypothetical protein